MSNQHTHISSSILARRMGEWALSSDVQPAAVITSTPSHLSNTGRDSQRRQLLFCPNWGLSLNVYVHMYHNILYLFALHNYSNQGTLSKKATLLLGSTSRAIQLYIYEGFPVEEGCLAGLHLRVIFLEVTNQRF